MLTQGRFLISYQIFDNIQVNNIGQTHVREILKDTQAFTINYRTEQIRDYLRYQVYAKRKNNHLKQRTYENNKSFIKNHNQSEW